MHGAHLAHLGKCGGAVAHHMAAWRQVARSPLRHLLICEVRHRRQAHVQGPAIGQRLHSGHEGALVGRLAPAVDAVRTFSPEVGIVDLHTPLQRVARIALRHGLHPLVFESPCGFVANAQLALGRLSARALMAFLFWVSRYMARNHSRKGRWVCSITVPTMLELW